MLFESVSRRGWPFLVNLLQVHEASISESVQEEAQLVPLILLDGLQISILDLWFNVVSLRNESDEHESGSHNKGDSGIWVLLQLQETGDLVVRVLEAVVRHVILLQEEYGMRELVLVEEHQSEL